MSELSPGKIPVDRWYKLISTKLKRGYELHVHKGAVRLFRRGSGYEPCPTEVADLLLEKKLVKKGGKYGKFRVYVWADEAEMHEPIMPVAVDDDDDDDATLEDVDLEDVDDESPGDDVDDDDDDAEENED